MFCRCFSGRPSHSILPDRMLVFRRLPPASQRRPCVLTIGNFDGVHRGHQALLRQLGEAGARLALPACVLTFEPHPREFFASRRPGVEAPTRIAMLRDKLEALANTGIDRTCVVHFNERFATLPAETFIDEILVRGLQVRHLLVGDDFRFGAGRRGDFAMLEQAARDNGFSVERMQTVAEDGVRISSSEVRAALSAGDFRRVERMLGRPYSISGHVVHGRKLGRTLGFPTLNLRIPHGRPAIAGIHVVRVHGLGPAPHEGVASLGTRPAVQADGHYLLEAHVFDFDRDAYGELVSIEFLHKLRDEANYDTLDALVAQIRIDAEQARQHFNALRTAATAAGCAS
jgi:riboflavin kinase / FMN adenylyltransferase